MLILSMYLFTLIGISTDNSMMVDPIKATSRMYDYHSSHHCMPGVTVVIGNDRTVKCISMFVLEIIES